MSELYRWPLQPLPRYGIEVVAGSAKRNLLEGVAAVCASSVDEVEVACGFDTGDASGEGAFGVTIWMEAFAAVEGLHVGGVYGCALATTDEAVHGRETRHDVP